MSVFDHARGLFAACALGAVLWTPATAQEAPKTIRIAYNLTETTNVGHFFQVLAAEIERNTAGTSMPLKPQLFGNGQLYNDTQMPDALGMGSVEIGGLTLDFINQKAVEPLRIGSIPYLFDSWEALWASEDNERYIGAFVEKFGEIDMQFMAAIPYGTVEFFSSKPLRVPEDLQGQRIRAFGIETSLLIQEVGATPVSLSSQELYQALQRGTVDGLVSGAPSVFSRKFYEVVKHGTSGNMIYYSIYAAANKAWWESLPEDVREAIGAANVTALQSARGRVKGEIAEMEKSLTEAGLTLVDPVGEEREKWVEASSGRLKDYKAKAGALGEELLSVVEKANADHPAAE